MYCQDNEKFIDNLLTFATPHCLQKIVFGLKQGKYQLDLISDTYVMKIVSLIFTETGAKPYLYQLHLWQLLNSFSPSETMVKNLFFAFQMQYERVSKTQNHKELTQAIDVTYNGIVQFT